MKKWSWSDMSERERDALVAEKVMGWTKSGMYRDTTFGVRSVFPKYTTDISSAWEVVEKFPSYHLQKLGGISERVRVSFWYVRDERWYMSTGATAPEAICLAALKAVGVDI